MTPLAARIAFAVLALVALSGFGLVDEDFDPNNPWFYIGLVAIIVVTVTANALRREFTTRRLSDEFEAGYRVGYRAGRRTSLTVARPRPSTAPSGPIPLRVKRAAKSNEHKHTWLDSEDFLPGSTRRR